MDSNFSDISNTLIKNQEMNLTIITSNFDHTQLNHEHISLNHEQISQLCCHENNP